MINVVVCASGGGGNLAHIVAMANSLYQVTRVLVDRECGARQVAAEGMIPVFLVPRQPTASLSARFLEAIPENTDLVVLAGFMTILPKQVTDSLSGRMINTHPSLLPRHGGIGFYGVRVHEAVVASGDQVTGCTVHFVTSEVDRGPIIAQSTIAMREGESPWELGKRVFDLEGPLLVASIDRIARGV